MITLSCWLLYYTLAQYVVRVLITTLFLLLFLLALHLSPPFPPLPIPAYVDLLVTGVMSDFVH